MCPNAAAMLVPGVVGIPISSCCIFESTAAVSAFADVWIVWSNVASVSWRMLKIPWFALREARSALRSASGMGSPLAWWPLIRLSASGCQHQFSSICDGASTKSRSTRVPANMASSAREQIWCITWPNSWKKVSTSL